jgi:predicted membrane protein
MAQTDFFFLFFFFILFYFLYFFFLLVGFIYLFIYLFCVQAITSQPELIKIYDRIQQQVNIRTQYIARNELAKEMEMAEIQQQQIEMIGDDVNSSSSEETLSALL